MPGSQWTYASGEWRTTFTFADAGITAGQRVMGFWVDGPTGKRTPTLTVQLY